MPYLVWTSCGVERKYFDFLHRHSRVKELRFNLEQNEGMLLKLSPVLLKPVGIINNFFKLLRVDKKSFSEVHEMGVSLELTYSMSHLEDSFVKWGNQFYLKRSFLYLVVGYPVFI